MGQEIKTSLMLGGLDLASSPIAIPPGKAIAAVNYEPDVAGYTSLGGYERFDGQPRPSDATDPADVASRRSAIREVPGVGTVRGVWVFSGDIYAFRDQVDGTGAMFRSSSGGWEPMQLGHLIPFIVGLQELLEGEYVIGQTSAASAFIERVIVQEGDWGTTASGYLIVSQLSGTFVSEQIESSSGGEATGAAAEPVALLPGGRYDFTNHNFYGSAKREHMYFCSGADTAYEWSGTVLSPVRTGITGALSGDNSLLAANGDIIKIENDPGTTGDDDFVIVAASFDQPIFITHYKNHLFLAYTSGTLINSSLGEPLEYSTATGAGEISFGQQITGLLTAAATSLVIFANNRVEYLTGDSSDSFVLNPLSDVSGAKPYTIQMMDAPVFLDDGGVRSLSATAAFGDWRMGTLTQPVERLLRQKRDVGIQPVASLRIKGKDQYRLFWEDGTGITVYVGRKVPETLPLKLPISVYCSCSGEVENGYGDRLFVGCQDGFVYEMNRGTSYDGAEIESYIRLPFTAEGSPSQHTRWMKASFEMDTPDDITVGVAFDTDYARGLGGAATNVGVDAGSAIVTSELYTSVDWTQPVQGTLEYHLQGIGPNISATLIHNSAVARQHTISSQTYNFSRRRTKR